jgi:hypothetical protein
MEKQPQNPEEMYIVPKKNTKIGLFLLIVPIATIFMVMISHTILSFVNSAYNVEVGSSLYMTTQIANVILSLLGLISTFGLLVGIPFGIIYLTKKELRDNTAYDPRSGKTNTSVVSNIPEEIKGWNWGAAGLSWIWGIYHGVWISLLMFVPIVNIIMVFFLGLNGNEWAWKAKKWTSVEQFVASQKKWKPWGILFFSLFILKMIAALRLLMR